MTLRTTHAPDTAIPAHPAVWWHERKVTCQHCRRTYHLKAEDEVDLFGRTHLYAAGRFRCRHCETWNALDRPTS
jgi:hypothetical protein